MRSTVEPAGTCVYAQSTWRPSGARLGSTTERLHDEHIRTLRMPAAQHLPLGRGDLGARAAEVHGRRGRDPRIRPRHRPREREVELRDARSAPEAREPTPVTSREGFAGVTRQELGRGVEQRDPARLQVGRRAHLEPGVDTTAERSELRDQGIRDRLRPANRHAPSRPVGVRAEQQPGPGGRERRMPPRRVRGDPGEERVRREVAEAPSARERSLLEHAPGVAEGVDRMRRHPQQLPVGERRDAREVLDERAEQAPPGRRRRRRVREPCDRGRGRRWLRPGLRADARRRPPG